MYDELMETLQTKIDLAAAQENTINDTEILQKNTINDTEILQKNTSNDTEVLQENIDNNTETLQESVNVGSVKYITTPEKADIYMDDLHQDVKTPCTIDNIPVGDHSFKLTLEGYGDVKGTLNIEAGFTTIVTAEMQKLIEKVGYIHITTIPEDAKIELDNVEYEKLTPLLIDNITPGKHFLKLTLDGYEDYVNDNVIVKENEMIYIHVKLEHVKEGVFTKLILMTAMAGTVIGLTKLKSKE